MVICLQPYKKMIPQSFGSLSLAARCLLQSACCLTEFLHNRVVEQRSKFLNFFIVPARVYSIAEQYYCYFFLEVKPKGSASKAKVANAVSGEIVAGTGVRRGWGIEA